MTASLVLWSFTTTTAAPRPTSPTPPAIDSRLTSSSSVEATEIAPCAVRSPPAEAATWDEIVVTPIAAPIPTTPPATPPITLTNSRSSTALTLTSPLVETISVSPPSMLATVPLSGGTASASLAVTSAADGALSDSESAPLLVMSASRSSLLFMPSAR